MLTVRPFRSSDADAILSLVAENDSGDTSPQFAGDLIQRLAQATSVVAVEGDQLVGFASLGPSGHIDSLNTHPRWQGQGVGSRLIESLESIANRLHLPRLSADAADRLRPFFERKGYRVAERKEIVEAGENSVRLHFVKELTLDFSHRD